MKRWVTFEELLESPIPKSLINERIVELRLVVNNDRKAKALPPSTKLALASGQSRQCSLASRSFTTSPNVVVASAKAPSPIGARDKLRN